MVKPLGPQSTARSPQSLLRVVKPRKVRPPRPPRLPVPLEHDEQVELFRLIDLYTPRYPELACCFAIPNGSHKSKAAAAKFKREGLRSGVPDIMCAFGRRGKLGLFIEMKRLRGSVVSTEQAAWHSRLEGEGYRVVVCYGAVEAWDVLSRYVGIK